MLWIYRAVLVMEKDVQEKRPKKRPKKKPIIIGVLTIALIGLSVYAAVTKVSDSRTNTFISTKTNIVVQESNSELGTTEVDGETVFVSDDNDWTNVTNSMLERNDFTWTTDVDTSTATKYVRIYNADDDDNNTDVYVRVTFAPRWINDTIYSSEDENGSTEVITDDDGNQVSVDVINNEEISSSGSSSDNTYFGFYNFTVNGNTAYWTNSYYGTSNSEDDIILKLTLDSDWTNKWFYNETDGYFYYKEKLAPGESTTVLVTGVTIDNELLTNIDDAGDTIQFELDVLSDAVQALGGAIADYGESTDDDKVRWKNVQKDTDENLTESSTAE